MEQRGQYSYIMKWKHISKMGVLVCSNCMCSYIPGVHCSARYTEGWKESDYRCVGLQTLCVSEHLYYKNGDDNHGADRKEQMITETMRIRRGADWRRWAELLRITSTGLWSLISSTWQTEATEHRVNKLGDINKRACTGWWCPVSAAGSWTLLYWMPVNSSNFSQWAN